MSMLHDTPADTAPTREPAPAPRPTGRAGIFGIGAVLPGDPIPNAAFEQRLETSDAWIVKRTGIHNRHYMAPQDSLAALTAEACLLACADAGVDPSEVDRVLVATVTPDRAFPAMAPEVASIIGATGAAALDLSAACAGFLYGLDQAAALVETGRANTVLVAGAEALSRMTDHDDRGTAVLFGDGAGAAVVGRGELELGCSTFVLGSDGACGDLLFAERDERLIRMQGREVYRHAVRRMVDAIRRSLAQAGMTAADLDLFVTHQANARIIEAVQAELGITDDQVVLDLDRAANTSAASIPLALARAEQEGRLRPGMRVGLAAFGAGFVWAAGVISWKERVGVYL